MQVCSRWLITFCVATAVAGVINVDYPTPLKASPLGEREGDRERGKKQSEGEIESRERDLKDWFTPGLSLNANPAVGALIGWKWKESTG